MSPLEINRRELMLMTACAGGLVVLSGEAGAEAVGTSRPSKRISLLVNGQRHELDVATNVTLLDALRDYLHLTGTKKGCDHGQCGACTVLSGGRRVLSCLTLAICEHEGNPIETIEGLSKGERLHPLQAAFIEHDAFQCGYCTPGQIMSAVGLFHEGRPPDDDAIRERMAGNLCRCGAYEGIVSAIRAVRDQDMP